MKSTLLVVGIILTCLASSIAQQKTDKYCEVRMFTSSGFSQKIKLSFSGGSIDSLFSFKDSTIISNLAKVKEMATIPDVLNYMSSLGWTPVNMVSGGLGLYTVIFRRTFDMSELTGH